MKNDSLDLNFSLSMTSELWKPFGVMIHELFLSYFFLRSFLLFLSASKIKFLTLRDKTIQSELSWSITWCLCWHWPWSRVSWGLDTCRGRGPWSRGTGRAGQPLSVTRWSRPSGESVTKWSRQRGGIIGIQQLMMATISIRVNREGIMDTSHFATHKHSACKDKLPVSDQLIYFSFSQVKCFNLQILHSWRAYSQCCCGGHSRDGPRQHCHHAVQQADWPCLLHDTGDRLNGSEWCEIYYNAITRKILLCRRDLMLLAFLKVVSSSGLLPHYTQCLTSDLPCLEAWLSAVLCPWRPWSHSAHLIRECLECLTV